MAQTKKIEFAFELNSDNFNRNLKSANDNIKMARNEMDKAGDDIVKFGKNSEQLAKQYQAIEKAISSSKDKIDLFSKEIEKSNKKIDDNKNKLVELTKTKDDLTKKYNEAVKVYGKESDEAQKLKDELDKLNKQYKNSENAIANSEKKIQNYTVAISNAEKDVSKLETELVKCNKEIENNANKFLNAQQKLQSASTTFVALGGSISEASNKLLGLSTPIALAGVAIAKMEMDFESSLAKVNTLLVDSTVGIDKFREGIIELSNNTGTSVNDLSESLYEALSAGVEAGESMEFITQANKLATGGFTTTTSAINILTTALNAYGLEATETERISDILVQTQNKGKTTVSELASNMGKIIPTAKAVNVNMEQLGASYSIMTSKGIATAEATTYMNSMLNEMGKSGTKASDAIKEISGKSFQDLMSEGKNVGEVLAMLDEYAKNNSLSMADMFGSSEAAKAGLILVENAGQDFTKMLGEMNNSMGSTEKAFKTMSETEAYKLKRSMENVKNSFLDVGKALMPTVEVIAENIAELAKQIGKMDAETVANTIKLAGWGVALGTAGKAVGGITTGIGGAMNGLSKLAGMLGTTTVATTGTATATTTLTATMGALAVPLGAVAGVVGVLAAGFYAVHEANDVMNSSVVKSKEEFSAMEKGMASLMGVQLQSREELEKQGLIYKEFNENISSDFISNVEKMRDDILNFNVALNDINFDNVFTEEEMTKLEQGVTTAVDGAINAINNKSKEMNSSMSDLFAVDGVLSEKETEIMKWWSTRGDKEIEETKTLQNEITEIEKTAFAEGRTLTSDEIKAIEDRYAQIKQIELLASATNSEELLYAQKEFETQVAGLDAKSASELLKQKRTQADDILQQKKVEIEVLKAQTMEGYDSLSAEDKKHVDETIAMFDESYNQLKDQNNKFYADSLTYLEDHNKEAYDKIDKYTGDVLTVKDEKNKAELEKEKSKYSEIDSITEEGMYKMYNKITGTYDDLYIKIDEVTGDIIGLNSSYSDATGTHAQKVVGANADIKKSMQDLQDSYVQDMNRIKTSTVNDSNEVVMANGKVVSSLEDVKKNADGTKDGIIKLNGNSVKVKVEKDGTITALDEITRKINNIPSYKQVTVGVVEGKWNGSTMYATGTNRTNDNEIALVNEKGWELFDNAISTPFTLSNTLQGDMAYLPEGTRVQTHLSSTQQMQQAVTREVASQVSNSNSEMIKAINNISKIIGNVNTANNSNINVDDVLDKIVIETVTNLNDREIMRVLTPLISKETYKYEKRRGY